MVDKHVESIVNQFRERSKVGIDKYGVTLERNDLSTLEWIEHAKQEAMDFILYLERLKEDEQKKDDYIEELFELASNGLSGLALDELFEISEKYNLK
jgi:hypothetical protein